MRADPIRELPIIILGPLHGRQHDLRRDRQLHSRSAQSRRESPAALWPKGSVATHQHRCVCAGASQGAVRCSSAGAVGTCGDAAIDSAVACSTLHISWTLAAMHNEKRCTIVACAEPMPLVAIGTSK